VIDYKSGSGSVADWLSEPPTSPQLPVYALALGEGVAAIAVGSLKSGEVGYIGLGSDGDLAPGIRALDQHRAAADLADDWMGLMQLWRRRLEAVADAHQAGEAAVDPRSSEACRFCHLTVLCRRHELAAESADEAG
jgi:hypothetical protein